MESDQSHYVSPVWRLFGSDTKHRPSGGRIWRRACAGALFAAAFACVAQDGQPAPASQNAGPQAQSSSPASAKPVVDPLDKPRAPESNPQPQPQPAPESHRRNQISIESTQLLAMAVALKAEVDKTNKDTLSLNVIRKADAIEKLAKTVKEKMKQSSGPS